MILSDAAITEALDTGRLVIDPEPAPRSAPGVAETPFNASSVDLQLGGSIMKPREGLSVALDPGRGSASNTLHTLYEPERISQTGYVLHPREFVLASTAERVELPLGDSLQPSLAARVEGRSSLARYGLLVHFTAPTIHAGFAGTITLEMINLGPSPIVLRQGMRICQLIVEEVAGIPLRASGTFHGQDTPAGPSR